MATGIGTYWIVYIGRDLFRSYAPHSEYYPVCICISIDAWYRVCCRRRGLEPFLEFRLASVILFSQLVRLPLPLDRRR